MARGSTTVFARACATRDSFRPVTGTAEHELVAYALGWTPMPAGSGLRHVRTFVGDGESVVEYALTRSEGEPRPD